MSDGGGIPDLSTILSRVTENPQAMSMLSSLLGGMGKPSEPSPTRAGKEQGEGGEPSDEATETPVLAMGHPPPKGGGRREEKRRLLLALKPFLSRERRGALEALLLVLDATALFAPGKEPPCT